MKGGLARERVHELGTLQDASLPPSCRLLKRKRSQASKERQKGSGLGRDLPLLEQEGTRPYKGVGMGGRPVYTLGKEDKGTGPVKE